MGGDELWHDELRKLMIGEILFDEPAASHTSIGVGGRIDALCFPESEGELASVVAFLRARRLPFLPVGNWTNLIVRGDGYRGVLISTTGLRALKVSDAAEGCVRLEAQAGLPLAELVNLSVREALAGMEFCAGIPGSVGGAVRMNAGAYGGEIKDICLAVRLIDPAEGIRALTRAELDFSYRNLDLPAESIIIGAAFQLRRGRRREDRRAGPRNHRAQTGETPPGIPERRFDLQEPEGGPGGAAHRSGGPQGNGDR